MKIKAEVFIFLMRALFNNMRSSRYMAALQNGFKKGEGTMRATVAVVVACLSLISVTSANDAEAAIHKPTNIGSQELAPALKALATQRNVQLVYRSDLVKDQLTGGAAGDLTLDEALTQILMGTGLTHKYLERNAFTIVPAELLSANPAMGIREAGDAGNQPFQSRLLLTQSSSTSISASGSSGTEEPGTRGSGTNSKLSPVIEEVIITAEKRATDLQTTAIAVSALSGQQMQDRQIYDMGALMQALPNVDLSLNQIQPKIAIRGIGMTNLGLDGPEPRVAFQVDNVYFARPEAALGNFFDLQRVEVLRGPQGTLYGRNATGGTINVITADPDDVAGGYVNLGYANYSAVTAEGALTGPLTERLSGRVAFRVENHDGYGENTITGNRVDEARPRAFRVKLKFDVSDNVELLLSSDYLREKARAGATYYLGGYSGQTLAGVALGGVTSVAARTIASDYDPGFEHERWGVNLQLTAKLGALDFRSISGFRRLSNDDIAGDADSSSLPLTLRANFARASQVTEELHLGQSFSRGDWLLGAYLYQESLQSHVAVGISPIVFDPTAPIAPLMEGNVIGGWQNTHAYAVFANGKYRLSDTWTLNVGGRYSWEKQAVNEGALLNLTVPYFGIVRVPTEIPPGSFGVQTQNAARTDHAFTPKVTMEFQPWDEMFLYATYARGFKSGGFSLGAVQQSFAPEDLTDYEVGLKADWFNRRLQSNLSIFHYDYTNLQVTTLTNVNDLPVLATTNAGKSRIDGAEIELVTVPADNLRLELNYAYLKARYAEYRAPNTNMPQLGVQNLAGNRMTQAPSYTANIAAQYGWPTPIGTFTLRAEGRWVGQVFFTSFEEQNLSSPAHDNFNAFLNYADPSSQWTAGAYIRNITNRVTKSNIAVGFPPLGFPVQAYLDPPRVYGITVGRRF